MFPFEQNKSSYQQGGKGENMLHVLRNIGLKGHSNLHYNLVSTKGSNYYVYIKCNVVDGLIQITQQKRKYVILLSVKVHS